jgi:1,4-alpha-glucan branching enzyme
MLKISRKAGKASVTFTYTPKNEAESVELKGSWNDWESQEMKKKKDGDFYVRKNFKEGDEFEFGYLINGDTWDCDDEAESVPSPFGGQNSLLKI